MHELMHKYANMHLIHTSFLCFLLWLLIPDYSLGQYIYSRETRIDKQQAPLNAQAFIDSCFVKKQVKWFLSESQRGLAIEAKAKLGGHIYSIEFDTLGYIQDVGKKVKFKSLDPEIKENITQSLSQRFRKYKIKKTQVQWRATNSTLQLLLKSGNAQSDYSIRYELSISGLTDNGLMAYEVLCNELGELEHIFQIVELTSEKTNASF